MKPGSFNVWKPIAVVALFIIVALLIVHFNKRDENVIGARAIPSSHSNDTPSTSPTPYAGNTGPAASAIINLTGAHDIIIRGKSIRGGMLSPITLTNCYNIHITQNRLYNSKAVGIRLYNCKNITIDHNYFTNVSSGVYAELSAGGGMVVNHNQFLNMAGPFPRGQFVQFNNVNGPGNSVSYNRGENIVGQSHPEDAINLYKSNGTPRSPIMIRGNWIRGGGPSPSGGGIMLGDNGGSYLLASDNVLVNPGQYGIAVAGGDHNTVARNIIYGRAQHFTNVGIYVWGQTGHPVTNCTVTGNKVKYFNNKNLENNSWLAPGTGTPVGWENNKFGAPVDPSILPRVIITSR